MHWNISPSHLVARLYYPGNAYENEDPYIVVAYITLLADGEAWIGATLSKNDDILSWRQWWNLAHMLRDEYGVTVIKARHQKKPFVINTKRKRH
jgi:hypothetical protein